MQMECAPMSITDDDDISLHVSDVIISKNRGLTYQNNGTDGCMHGILCSREARDQSRLHDDGSSLVITIRYV